MDESSKVQPLALIVDDDETQRKFLATMVAAAGFRIEEACGGVEALAVIRRGDPALILLHLQTPDKDGIDVMQGMAGIQSSAKLVIFSDNDSRILEVAAEIARQRGLGVVAALRKPVVAEQLRYVLEHISLEMFPFDEVRLRECLRNESLRLHYQPKIDLPTRRITGVEALLRCQDSTGRQISPELVVAVAEECGAVDELSDQVFATAIEQRRRWSEEGLDLGMAVNLSARGAIRDDLPEWLAAKCVKGGVPTDAVTIELTETAVMNDHVVAMETLLRLRLRGFALSIDDFGTGYSSLVRLQQMPFSELKIDKSFVLTREKAPQNEVFIRTLAHLASDLNLKCVIEGVEDAPTLGFAAGLGCTSAQGYHISPALPADGIPRFVKEWHTRQKWQRKSQARQQQPQPRVQNPPQHAPQAVAAG